jgi:hypothetical protein
MFLSMLFETLQLAVLDVGKHVFDASMSVVAQQY